MAQSSGGPLTGMRVAVTGEGPALWHAARLLAAVGATVVPTPDGDVDGVLDATAAAGDAVPVVRTPDTSAAQDWAASGAQALTGRRDGPALAAPGMPASAARGALLATELLARIAGSPVTLPGPGVLSERAALAGLHRDAPRSVGGALRLLRTADGWLGVNVARASDAGLLSAWLEAPVPAGDPWPVLTELVARRAASPLAERARLLGLPVGAHPAPPDEQLAVRGQTAPVWPLVLNGEVRRAGELGREEPRRRAWTLPPTFVVDLSSLWAGPLCGHLLTLLGARVVKVESTQRPDGARFGAAAFYDLLHGGQESVALDFHTREGRAALAGLVAAADVVIEASRPRALCQLGVEAEHVLARSAAKCWVSITGYGRNGPWANAAGFGDDAAIAGGLVAFDPQTGVPAPCGDAIADPLTGVHAAFAVVACRLGGGTWLADLALREQAAATVETVPTVPTVPVAEVAPVPRRPSAPASALGAHTAAVLAELGLA